MGGKICQKKFWRPTGADFVTFSRIFASLWENLAPPEGTRKFLRGGRKKLRALRAPKRLLLNFRPPPLGKILCTRLCIGKNCWKLPIQYKKGIKGKAISL